MCGKPSSTSTADQRDRPEPLADAAGAEALYREQAGQHEQRQRDHPVVQLRRRDFEAFDGRQHRDRRCDDAVAVEDGGAEQADRHQRASQPRLVGHRMRGQRQHRDQPAFAVVVGAQDQQHVLQRDDDRDGPEDQRQHAQDVGRRGLQMAAVEDFLQCVQRAGADVAIDHTECRQRQCGQGSGRFLFDCGSAQGQPRESVAHDFCGATIVRRSKGLRQRGCDDGATTR
jgi:hypothetical protein